MHLFPCSVKVDRCENYCNYLRCFDGVKGLKRCFHFDKIYELCLSEVCFHFKMYDYINIDSFRFDFVSISFKRGCIFILLFRDRSLLYNFEILTQNLHCTDQFDQKWLSHASLYEFSLISTATLKQYAFSLYWDMYMYIS